MFGAGISVALKQKTAGPVLYRAEAVRTRKEYECWSIGGGVTLQTYGDVSKPCTPGEHQNSW